MKTALPATATSIIGFAAFLLMVFWPAGTFDYWRGWAFIAVFALHGEAFLRALGALPALSPGWRWCLIRCLLSRRGG